MTAGDDRMESNATKTLASSALLVAMALESALERLNLGLDDFGVGHIGDRRIELRRLARPGLVPAQRPHADLVALGRRAGARSRAGRRKLLVDRLGAQSPGVVGLEAALG